MVCAGNYVRIALNAREARQNPLHGGAEIDRLSAGF